VTSRTLLLAAALYAGCAPRATTVIARVRDADADRPVPGAVVTLVGDEEMMAATGPDGSTPPTSVPPHPTRVEAARKGYLEGVTWLENSGNKDGPVLHRGHTNLLDIDIYPDLPRSLIARLVGDGDRVHLSEGMISYYHPMDADSAAVDAAGSAFLDHVPAGPLTLKGRAPGYRETVVEVMVTGGETLEVELALKDTLNTGIVEGQVTDARTRHAISGVTVRVNTLGIEAVTDREGFYRLPKVPTGEYELTTFADGYVEAKMPFRVIAGWTVSVDLRLSH
jgi:hypothetical protein